jgi:hypothetical protein
MMLLVMLLGVVNLALASTLTGTVKFSDGSNVQGAVVTTDRGGKTTTDALGQFKFDPAPVGEIKIAAWVLGWKPSPFVTVTVPATGSVDAALTIAKGQETDKALSYTIYRANITPTIDGVIDEKEWFAADPIDKFYVVSGGTTLATKYTQVRALYDDSALYVAFDCSEDNMSGLPVPGTIDSGQDNYSWTTDHVSVYIDLLSLHGGPTRNVERLYQLDFNSVPAPDTAWSDILWWPQYLTNGWDTPGFPFVVNRLDDRWIVEMKIPFSLFPETGGSVQTGDVLGLLFTRKTLFPKSQSTSTAYVVSSYGDGGAWNDVVLGDINPKCGTLSGTVRYSNNQPVVGAAVVSSQGEKVYTDSNGRYTISGLVPGEVSVMASTLGWKPSAPYSTVISNGEKLTADDLIISIANVTDQAPSFTLYHLPKGNSGPTIDGQIDLTTEWKDSTLIQPFYYVTTTTVNDTAVKTVARATYDDQNLYVAFDCSEPNVAGLISPSSPDARKGHDSLCWNNDDVVVFVDPLHRHGGFNNDQRGYQIDVNCIEFPDTGWADVAWNPWSMDWSPEGIEVYVKRGTSNWVAEMKIPFAGFPELGKAPDPGSIMGILFGRGSYLHLFASSTAYTSSDTPDGRCLNDIVFAGYKSGKVKGKVIYSDDSSGVPNATVQTDNGDIVVTDASGNFEVTSPSGTCRVRAWIFGMKPSNVTTVEVPASGSVTANISILRGNYVNTTPAFKIYRTKAAPLIDGTVDTAVEWNDATEIKPFYNVKDDSASTCQQTVVRAVYDDKYLYFAFDCIEPSMDDTVCSAVGHDSAASVFEDDHVEIQFDPKHLHEGFDGTQESPWYTGTYTNLGGNEPTYQFGFNCNEGDQFGWSDLKNTDDAAGDTSYNLAPGDLKAVVKRVTGHWYLEVRLPFSAIPGMGATADDQRIFGMMCARLRNVGMGSSDGEWSGTDFTLWKSYMATQWNDVQLAGYKQQIGTFTSPANFIKAGKWSCFSLPAEPLNADPVALLVGHDVPYCSLQYWINTPTGTNTWQSYGSANGWTGPLTVGSVYWLLDTRSKTDTTINFMGSELQTDYEISVGPRQAAPYWVMLGTPFASQIDFNRFRFKDVVKRGDTWLTWDQAYSATDASKRIVETKLIGWEPSTSQFFTASLPVWKGDKEVMDPWYGYWFLVTDPNQLQIKVLKQ